VADNSWNGYEYNLLFECIGDGLYSDVARPLGCAAIEDSRALAIADLDNDGRLDMIVANNYDPPAIFLNRLKSAGNYLRVQLVGDNGQNPDAVGARVRVSLDEDGTQRKLTRWVEIGSGYCSQSDMRLHFGLGNADRIQSIEVDWPDGTSAEFTGETIAGICNEEIRINQGTGKIEQFKRGSVKDTASQTGRPVAEFLVEKR